MPNRGRRRRDSTCRTVGRQRVAEARVPALRTTSAAPAPAGLAAHCVAAQLRLQCLVLLRTRYLSTRQSSRCDAARDSVCAQQHQQSHERAPAPASITWSIVAISLGGVAGRGGNALNTRIAVHGNNKKTSVIRTVRPRTHL